MSEVKVFYAALKDYSVDEKSGGTVSGVCKVVRLADHEAIALALRRAKVEIRVLREQRLKLCHEVYGKQMYFDELSAIMRDRTFDAEILTALTKEGL